MSEVIFFSSIRASADKANALASIMRGCGFMMVAAVCSSAWEPSRSSRRRRSPSEIMPGKTAVFEDRGHAEFLCANSHR